MAVPQEICCRFSRNGRGLPELKPAGLEDAFQHPRFSEFLVTRDAAIGRSVVRSILPRDALDADGGRMLRWHSRTVALSLPIPR